MDIALAVLGIAAAWCVAAVLVAVVVGRMCVRRDSQVSAPEDRTAPPPHTSESGSPTRSHRPGA